MRERLNRPRGTPDWLPPESRRHEIVVARAAEIFRRFGYLPIQTPAFEYTELFERGLESTSDLVMKEMYTFEDKGGRSVTLRPDMTAPVMRAILERGLEGGPMPLKLYYFVPVFRRERPQAGRFRQFDQVGVEAIGRPGPQIDAEVIDLASAIYDELGVDAHLKLNTIGHPGCRSDYMPKLFEFLERHRASLCEDCQRKISTNPLRTFDCKVPSDRALLQGAPMITDHLCAECKDHYEGLKSILVELGHKYEEDPRLVRGLDYYTRTTFEFTSPSLGSQDAVGGGGRYDGLSEALGGPPLPAIGFGLGVARIAMAMPNSSIVVEPLDAYVIAIGDEARADAMRIATQLRRRGFSVDLDTEGGSVRSQFKAAARREARFAIVVGKKEIAAGIVTMRDMTSGEEETLSIEEARTRMEKMP